MYNFLNIKNSFLLSCCLAVFPCLSFAQPVAPIFEPFFVERPPDNAFNGLVLLPGGELRHYGFVGAWFHPSGYIYLLSRDNGLNWTRKTVTDPDLFVNENMPPAVRSPRSGDYIRLIGRADGTWLYRSRDGIDGPYEKKRIDTLRCEMFRQPFFLKGSSRIVVTCGRTVFQDGNEVMQSCVYYSDNDGNTWKTSFVPVGPRFIARWPHMKPRWQNYAIEPAIAELNDGRLWMLLRTSMDNLYESYSTDYGESWSNPEPSRFPGTLTMPSFLRLRDGRLLLFFCNTVPLAEADRSSDQGIRDEQKTGQWEDVFTNRDALHVAISDDDGLTWTGFRELYLNPLRNETDFATRGGKEVSLDKSVHQSQAIELPDNNVIVALGQHPLVRAMVIFNPEWLYEKSRFCDFSMGLAAWSVFKYKNGILGHCAYNRVQGPSLVKDPSGLQDNVLSVKHLRDTNLVCDIDGAVWNFPAAQKGTFSTSILLKKGSGGGTILLSDRWLNPSDTQAYRYAVYSISFTGKTRQKGQIKLQSQRWVELTFKWNDLRTGTCSLLVDGKPAARSLPLLNKSLNGISYVQFQSVSDVEDMEGYLVRTVKAVKNDRN